MDINCFQSLIMCRGLKLENQSRDRTGNFSSRLSSEAGTIYRNSNDNSGVVVMKFREHQGIATLISVARKEVGFRLVPLVGRLTRQVRAKVLFLGLAQVTVQ